MQNFNYEEKQLEKIKTSSEGYKITIQVHDFEGNKTNFLSITDEQFAEIKVILTGNPEKIDEEKEAAKRKHYQFLVDIHYAVWSFLVTVKALIFL